MRNTFAEARGEPRFYPIFRREGPAVTRVAHVTSSHVRGILSGKIPPDAGVPAVVGLFGTTRRSPSELADGRRIILPECADPLRHAKNLRNPSEDEQAAFERTYGALWANDYTVAAFVRRGESFPQALVRKAGELGGPFARLVETRLSELRSFDFDPTPATPFFEWVYLLPNISSDDLPRYPVGGSYGAIGAEGASDRACVRFVPMTDEGYANIRRHASGGHHWALGTVRSAYPSKSGFFRALDSAWPILSGRE